MLTILEYLQNIKNFELHSVIGLKYKIFFNESFSYCKIKNDIVYTQKFQISEQNFF